MANDLAKLLAEPLWLPQLASLTDEQGRTSKDDALEGKASERFLEFAFYASVEDPLCGTGAHRADQATASRTSLKC